MTNSYSYEDRIEQANGVLKTFVPIRLYKRRELRMTWDVSRQTFDFPARLRSDGQYPQFGYYKRPCGDTGLIASVQLIRFVRSLPRLPIYPTWDYWASERVQLCSDDTIEALRKSDYSEMTACVLCGRDDWKRGVDWWCRDRLTGPCCSFGTCIENRG